MISFLSRPPCLSYFISLVAPWNRLSWVRILYRCILMHSFVVKIVFPHACLDEAFAMSIGIPPLDKAIILYLRHGLSQALLLMCFLVSLWTHLLVVCGKDVSCTLYLFYSRLCWCLMLILILVFSSALPWLTHIVLVEPIPKLPLFHFAQPCVCCKCYA